ncbi:filament-like plant protein isoform X1 [Corylus avellana]|nr:filament-like plant protein isoform X2 [Corylus avellana]XP_059449009.1 filament-like plant protein isoform X2 [Corylus avellana]XP_059449010.1 filament-like plant protein isoform X2 [Corylus avellana]XP_059449011.1 filament-like plant protein isoform X2 [Corylus avellana]XP_059449012.1 filament-like plant protein isoform X2 [Corylus avellana]XP_059449013.1 filament-like plant protein isoform X2 [Corylus avellana]XP_059461916.1 filament-like plant protein isoform X1 [Corylus avellana]XP_0
MEKKKWLWKRKSSDKSTGETESSGSISSHSERYSDDQETFKSSPNDNTQSPEVTSKAVASAEDVDDGSSKKDVNDSVKSLMEKLSAALVNVSAKDDLARQHAKVAEEAVAGWEKAENEVVVLKQQFESAVQQNLVLEDRVSHLDGAIKELVRQLRQSREEHEQKIDEAVVKKTREWETTRLKLENQILELQSKAEAAESDSPANADPELCHRIEYLERENSALKLELQSQSEELEIRTIERDLSTQAAEMASKQHLESIKKVAKLEAECRRLKSMASKSSPVTDHKSVTASSICVESLTDSQSESEERLSLGEVNTRKMSSSEPNKCESSCSDTWASALIAELDQFKNEKAVKRNLPASSVHIDLMDDFLEMERLAALPETKNGSHCLASEVSNQTNNVESSLRTELGTMSRRIAELEETLEKMEAQKTELEIALITSQDCIETSQLQMKEAEMKLEELQRELNIAKEKKQVVDSRLSSMEAEATTMAAKVECLEVEVQKEKALSAEIAGKCRKLEEELSRKRQEIELQKTASSNGEFKIKEEDLAVAAGKLAECQKTIASLGNQLKSLATLEDFLIDTPNLPEISAATPLIPKADGEPWKLHSNETYSPKRVVADSSKIADESSGPLTKKTEENSPPSSSSSAALSNHVSSEKNRNGFAKFFSRTKSGVRLEI